MERTDRLNSLLREVISEVIMKDAHNPRITALVTVKKVIITKDLHHAKVYVSFIGPKEEQEKSLQALQSAAGFISVQASKKVVMLYFPTLTFYLDNTLEEELKIHSLLETIREEHRSRPKDPN
jgi:ribosome-binding factor A